MELIALIGVLIIVFKCCQSSSIANPELICPHCGVKGQVRTRSVRQKKGISGGKAVGAVLTCGVSILATGLSRKEDMTRANCENCDSVWYY
jgi:hypothetical protein